MICRFCSQWNPKDSIRCAFCNNPAEADEDLTASGRATLSQRGLADPKHARPTLVQDDGEVSATGKHIQLADNIWKVIIALAIAGWILFQIIFDVRC